MRQSLPRREDITDQRHSDPMPVVQDRTGTARRRDPGVIAPDHPRSLVRAFLETLEAEKQYSAHTVSAYANDLERLCVTLDGVGGTVADVDRSVLRSHIVGLYDSGLSSSSVARHIAAIRSFFTFLVRRGIL